MDNLDQNPIICPGCKNEINTEVCWCGDYRAGHNYAEHPFVPMGCDCMRYELLEDLILKNNERQI